LFRVRGSSLDLTQRSDAVVFLFRKGCWIRDVDIKERFDMGQEDKIFDYFLHVMPLWQRVSHRGIGVAVTDRKKYLLYKPGKGLDLKVPAGTLLKPGTAVVKAMEQNKTVTVRGDKAVFGLPYIAVAHPIIDESGKVVGGFVLIESTEQQDALKEMAAQLNDSIGILAGTTEEISAQTQEIAGVSEKLTNVAQESQLKRPMGF